MRMSKLFLPTLREIPADASVISHQLMLRAGMIRKVSSGIYTFLPLGLRVIKKISRIIQEEMDKAGGQEILMPMVQPIELWNESGRANQYGPELLRFKDRKNTAFCLGPTHEEVITSLVADHVKSYKALPLILYQIQTKFRDEIRPRFGLMRMREFIMKDAYSFAVDKKSQEKIYQDMWDAYHHIFERCGLRFKAVQADTGSIGGDMSHEFQVLANSGEDAIAVCNSCGYAANTELALIKQEKSQHMPALDELKKVSTPGQKSIEGVKDFLKVSDTKCIKSLVYRVDEKLVMVLVRGDQDLSEAKLKKYLLAKEIALATEVEVLEQIGPVGFIGPVNVPEGIKVVADGSLEGLDKMVAGANEVDHHLININVARDIRAKFLDLAEARVGSPCGSCGSPYEILRGIEVGHIFYLGKKYSKAFSACVQNDSGKNVAMEMGCYGIGVGRTVAASIEQNHDDKGIIWPKAIAPYHVHMVCLGKDESIMEVANDIYHKLSCSKMEVLLDDRDERAGVKLNDADLIGCPIKITLGKRGLKNKEFELVVRSESAGEPHNIKLDSDYVTDIKRIFDRCR